MNADTKKPGRIHFAFAFLVQKVYPNFPEAFLTTRGIVRPTSPSFDHTHSCDGLCLRNQPVDVLRVIFFLLLDVGHSRNEEGGELNREMRLRVVIYHVVDDRLNLNSGVYLQVVLMGLPQAQVRIFEN
jgi:hypothetical protein